MVERVQHSSMGSLKRSGQFLTHNTNRGTDKKAGNTASDDDQNILQSMRLCYVGKVDCRNSNTTTRMLSCIMVYQRT